LALAYILSSPQGRISRSEFWAGFVVLALAAVAAASVILATLGRTPAGRIGLILLVLVLLYPWFAVFAKRFQDRGRPGNQAIYAVAIGVVVAVLWIAGLFHPSVSGWLLVAATVAVVGWYVVDLGTIAGMPGPNRYGPDPRHTRT